MKVASLFNIGLVSCCLVVWKSYLDCILASQAESCQGHYKRCCNDLLLYTITLLCEEILFASTNADISICIRDSSLIISEHEWLLHQFSLDSECPSEKPLFLYGPYLTKKLLYLVDSVLLAGF